MVPRQGEKDPVVDVRVIALPVAAKEKAVWGPVGADATSLPAGMWSQVDGCWRRSFSMRASTLRTKGSR